MSKVSFLDKIKDMKLSSFQWLTFKKDVTSSDKDGKRATILIFELEHPIEKVISSNAEYNPTTRERVHDFKTDVLVVKCNVDVIEQFVDDFTFEEKDDKLTGAGKYHGDLFLDLSRAGDVWLTPDKFSKMGADFRVSNRNERFQTIMKKWGGNDQPKKD